MKITREESFINKYGKEEGLRRYNEWRASVGTSLKNFIKKHGAEEGTRLYEEHCKKQGQSLEKFIAKYGEDEGNKKYKSWVESSRISLENCISRYGEVEGKKRYEERYRKNTKEYQLKDVDESLRDEIWKAKHAYKDGSLESFIHRHGIDDGTKRYEIFCNKCKNPITKFINKYGIDDGTKRYEHWKSKTPRNLDDFIRLYGIEDGTKRHAEKTEKTKNNLINFVRLYGEVDGTKRYTAFCEKLANRKSFSYSQESIKVYNTLQQFGITDDDIESFFTSDNEFYLIDEKMFLYDYHIKSKKILIDYHGEIYHPNVERYSIKEARDKFKKNKAKKNTFESQLEKDIKRKIAAENAGFKYLVIWSYDSKETIEEKIKNIL